jgi:hypothetical protein
MLYELTAFDWYFSKIKATVYLNSTRLLYTKTLPTEAPSLSHMHEALNRQLMDGSTTSVTS